MRQLRRLVAITLCALFALGLIVSSAFVLHGAGHDCAGEDCPVCAIITRHGTLLRLLGAAVVLIALASTPTGARNARVRALSHPHIAPITLIGRKIRLND